GVGGAVVEVHRPPTPTPFPNPPPPQVGPARLAHYDAKSGQARISWGREQPVLVARHDHVPVLGGSIALMKLLSMSEAAWISLARSRITRSASVPCRISISSPT